MVVVVVVVEVVVVVVVLLCVSATVRREGEPQYRRQHTVHQTRTDVAKVVVTSHVQSATPGGC